MRVIVRTFFSLLAPVLISSCATTGTVPPPPPAVADGAIPSSAVVVRAALPRGTDFGSTASQYSFRSIILLTQDSNSRNKKLCEAYVGKLGTEDVAKLAAPGTPVIPTYWPTVGDGLSNDCPTLLTNYDFAAAKILLQIYGKIDAKGPVMIIADKANRYAFIDLSKANKKDINKVVVGWYNAVATNGLQNQTIVSPSFLQTLGGLVCNTSQKVVAVHRPSEGGDPTDPATYGFDGKNWTRPSIFSIGSILVGGTITDLICGVVNA